MDPRGFATLEAAFCRATGHESWQACARAARHEVLADGLAAALRRLAADLHPLAQEDPRACDVSRQELEQALAALTAGLPVYRTYSRGHGLSPEDRAENIRRIGEVARLFVDAGLIVLCAAISPYRRDRALARALVGDGRFVEIFVDTELAECERRDPKGLYRKARAGEITGFSGIDAPYERPESPELRLVSGSSDDRGPEALAELANAAAALKTLDKNQDGQLTAEELHPGRGPGHPT